MSVSVFYNVKTVLFVQIIGPSGSYVSRHEEWRDVQTGPCVLQHAFRLIRNLCCGTSQYQLYSPSKKLAPAEDYSERTRKLSEAIPVVRSLHSQQDTILLFVEDASFLKWRWAHYGKSRDTCIQCSKSRYVAR